MLTIKVSSILLAELKARVEKKHLARNLEVSLVCSTERRRSTYWLCMILDFNDFLFKKWPKSRMQVSVFLHLLGLFRGARRYEISNFEVTNQKMDTFIGKQELYEVRTTRLCLNPSYIYNFRSVIFSDSLEISKLRSSDTL